MVPIVPKMGGPNGGPPVLDDQMALNIHPERLARVRCPGRRCNESTLRPNWHKARLR